MINQLSFERLAGQRFGASFVRPDYGGYCFAHIPATICRSLDLPAENALPLDVLPADRSYQRVIFMFIDSLGWRFVQKYLDESPFLQRFVQQGVVSQLTSMFPSTTAAHVTCIHTGLAPGESGVHEWYYYEPEADMVISPLVYSIPGNMNRDWLLARGLPAERLLPAETLYQQMQARGVESAVFQSRDYAGSAYSRHVCRGAQMVPSITWAEALVNLELLMAQKRGPRYYFLYLDSIDAVMHIHGPESRQVEAEIRAFLWQMEDFMRRVEGKYPSTLLLLSADHGQAELSPQTTAYVNHLLPEFEQYLQRDRLGRPLLLGGSARDLFLYIRPEALAEAESALSRALQGRAEVYRTSELLQDGFFGPKPSDRLQARLGNLVALPYCGQAVYWRQAGKFEQKFYGSHGGLTPEEMLIPLLALEL